MRKSHNNYALRPAVFLDRDGTLIEDKHYLHDPEEIVWIPGTFQALRDLRAQGYALVLITNQSGIGRGYFTEETVHTVHKKLAADLEREHVVLDGVYLCPHAPEEGCSCRKPGTDLIYEAVREHALDVRHSWFVGNTVADIEAGARCGMRTILVGKGDTNNINPTYIVSDLAEAVQRIDAS